MLNKVEIDLREVSGLGRDIHEGMGVGLTDATNRGVEITKEEIPELSGRLKEGVKPRVDLKSMTGEVEVSAIRPATPAREETVQLLSGRTKDVKFAAQPAYDYAQVVAEGSGLYGVRGQVIKPRRAKKLRFVIGGRPVFAGQVEGQKPNPYDERAANRLETEVDGIFGDAIERAANK